MFKKFLVLCAMLCCTALWGQSGDVASFEKEAKENANRALELSMYYQGWNEDECFYALDDDDKKSPISRIYVKNSELSRQIEMRDFDKALYWAEVAFRIEKENEKYLDEKICFNIMKLYIMRGEDFAKDTYDFFIKNITYYNFEKEGKIYGTELYRKLDAPFGIRLRYLDLHAYFYLKGFGVEQDIAFATELFERIEIGLIHNLSLANCYTSKYFVKDLEFLRFKAECKKYKLNPYYFLYLTYSGKFNASDKDEELSEKYFNLYKAIWDNLVEEKYNYWQKESLNKERAYIAYLEKYYYFGILHNKHIFIANPFYDVELGLSIIEKSDMENLHKFTVPISYLIMHYSISDGKKLLKNMLDSNALNLEEKNILQEKFDKCYNSTNRRIMRVYPDSIYDDLELIDFDSL